MIVDLAAERRRLIDGVPPDWACAWGQDRWGLFLGFAVGAATQLLRWIPPGKFLMGSPEEEAGRFFHEGPQHEVEIARGFWMFETPCTQALWTAVMGANPSRFQTSDRPVENVSWNEAQEFIARINERILGLALSLPSEAKWEYACRAGTTGSTYAGNVEILGAYNAPFLDPIAWYGGNSGEGYELEQGRKSQPWLEKQYPFQKAGTRRVRLKQPNAFGLYDMLGNVWEWVEDPYHIGYADAPGDGSVWCAEQAEKYVVRGGSYAEDAQSIRSALRGTLDPNDHRDFIGFRCARVQA